MQTRQLGKAGPRVSALGLGCMGMSDLYGPADRSESLATLRMALDAGMTLLDTGDFYGMGHNELLLHEALHGTQRERVQISVKFGGLRGPSGSWIGYDARPVAVKNFAAYSLKRLGTEYIDIYRPARLDPNVPIEDTVGAIADLVKEGHVRHIGLSEVGVDTIRRAHAVHPISDLQIEYSLISRSIEAKILPVCRELGIGVTAYGVLSRGLISGHWSKDRAPTAGDFRSHSPRFSADNIDQNLALVEALRAIAEAKDVTVAQIAIAWALSRGSDIVPLIGARRRDRLSEALGALEFDLTADDLAAIERAVPLGAAAGDRYASPTNGASRQRALDETTYMNDVTLTPDRILEAAEEVLRRFGPAKANVVDVARSLGVSHGSVYRHFPSKAALRDAVTERWLERVSRPLEAIVAGNGPAPDRLYRWCKSLMAAKRAKAFDDPELFATYMTLATDARDVVTSHVDTLISQIAAIIADGIERREVTVRDPQTAAQAVFDATSRFHHPAYAASWAEPGIDDAFEAVWSLILPGLVGRGRLSAASE